jgi:hypothetical protein
MNADKKISVELRAESLEEKTFYTLRLTPRALRLTAFIGTRMNTEIKIRNNGRMEYWNAGKKIEQPKPIIPSFHCSNLFFLRNLRINIGEK